MVTTVGTQNNIEDLVTNLVMLERDAIAPYDGAIERLSDPALAAQVEEFSSDHLEHPDILSEVAAGVGIEAPTQSEMKQMLTTGKIMRANLIGDSEVMKAMQASEDDTVTTHERGSNPAKVLPEPRAFLERALSDEVPKRPWMQHAAEGPRAV